MGGFCVLTLLNFFLREQTVSIDKVVTTSDEIGTSFRKDRKCTVHKRVMNLFCHLLFRETHPKYSQKHFFFSTVGVCCCFYFVCLLKKQTFYNYLCSKLVFLFCNFLFI